MIRATTCKRFVSVTCSLSGKTTHHVLSKALELKHFSFEGIMIDVDARGFAKP